MSSVRKAVIALTIALLAPASAASAADWLKPFRRAAAPAPTVQAPAVPIYNWSGPYVGVQAGYQIGSSVGMPINGLEPKTSGASGGGYVGINHQVRGAPLLIGVEADLNYSTSTGSSSAGPIVNDPGSNTNLIGTTADTAKETATLGWFATARGRIGLPRDTWLIYATGGFAVGELTNQLETNGIGLLFGAPNFGNSGFKTRGVSIGYTAGVGIEKAMTEHVRARIEYGYVSLLPEPAFGGTDIGINFHQAKAGVTFNY